MQNDLSHTFLWSYAGGNPQMLTTCFSIAQLIAYLSSFDSVCTRGQNDITMSLTMHIITSCVLVRSISIAFKETIRLLLDQRILLLFESLTDYDRVKTLFGLNQAFNDEVRSNSVNFFHYAALFLHDLWCAYKYRTCM